ncbi:hypothetical protein JCM10908_003268 [Rhodotorula pacifica]|uniref:rRNA-processing protein MPP10 n=1 Tax=Rhodotorula pacifica TaxID=1495444 RepID=UPI00317CEF9D
MPGLNSAQRSPSKRTSPSKADKKSASTSTSSSSPAKANGKEQENGVEQADEEDNELLRLAESVAHNAHLLVRGRGDDQLAQLARNVLKRSFDQAVESESLAFPHLSALLASLSPDAGPSTRSKAAAAATSSSHLEDDAEDDPSKLKIEPTPIPELTVDGGMDDEMIWEQMEMRGKTVDELMEAMFGQSAEDEEGGSDEEGFDDEDEEEEDLGNGGRRQMYGNGEMDGDSEEDDEEGDEEEEEMDFDDIPEAEKEEYFRKLADEEEEEDDDDEEEEDADANKGADPLADESSALTLDNFDGESGRKSKSRRSKPSGPPSAVDDQFFSLADFHRDADAGEYEMNKMLRGEDNDDEDDFDGLDGDDDGEGGIDLFAPVDGLGDDDDDEDGEEEEGDLDVGGVMYRDFFDPPVRSDDAKGGKGKGTGKGKGKGRANHSDDTSSPAKSRKPDTAAIEEDGAEPPAKKAKRGVRFSDAVKVKEIPHRLAEKKRLMALAAENEIDEETLEERLEELVAGSDEEDEDEDEAMGEEEEEDDESFGDDAGEMDLDGFGDEEMDQPASGSEDDDEEGDEQDEDEIAEGAETIDRFKSELFDDEPEEDEKTKNLSRHERRLLQLSSQIASLEQENVGPKDWATMGEAQSRDRPVNSLLEEDLDFERMGKVAPTVTEETTRTIEDLIKQRILAHQFDDVERRVAVDPNQFLPSRYIELQDTKSQKSLAEVYEDEFRDQRDREQGNEVVQEIDKDLMKRHDEIEALFEDLAARLDALSNAHFTPKAPKPSITTVSNLPSISVESALPTTHSTSTLLAPEEVYSATSSAHSALAIDAADLTPAQKKAQRQKNRQERKARAEKAERILAAREKKKGVRGEKEAAERKLVGVKGVTVIGKGGKEKTAAGGAGGKKRKRGEMDGTQPTSVGLKL